MIKRAIGLSLFFLIALGGAAAYVASKLWFLENRREWGESLTGLDLKDALLKGEWSEWQSMPRPIGYRIVVFYIPTGAIRANAGASDGPGDDVLCRKMAAHAEKTHTEYVLALELMSRPDLIPGGLVCGIYKSLPNLDRMTAILTKDSHLYLEYTE